MRDRRYWVHTIWVANVLWLHAQFWWAFWSYSGDIEWNYPKFLLMLTQAGLIYSIAITIASPEARTITSWREYFYRVRFRFCMLFAVWLLAITFSQYFILNLPMFHYLRAIQGGLLVLFIIGAVTSQPWFHRSLCLIFSGVLIFMATSGFFRTAPLISSP